MQILNQDKDQLFILKRSGLFKSKIYVKKKYYKGIFVGWNIYGKSLFKKRVLLGTYDTHDDVQQVFGEMLKLLELGQTTYTMPEPAIDLEDLEVTENA